MATNDAPKGLWHWLRDAENRGAVTLVVSVAGSVAAGLWALFLFANTPKQVSAPAGAPAASQAASRESITPEEYFRYTRGVVLVDRRFMNVRDVYDYGGGLSVGVRALADGPIVELRLMREDLKVRLRQGQEPYLVPMDGKKFWVAIGRIDYRGIEVVAYAER